MTGYLSKKMMREEEMQEMDRELMLMTIAKLKNSLAYAKQQKTLRDEFAMAALIGGFETFVLSPSSRLAEDIYEIADAMMKERNR